MKNEIAGIIIRRQTHEAPLSVLLFGKIAVIILIVREKKNKKRRQNYRIIRIFYYCMNDWLESNERAILSSFRAAILSVADQSVRSVALRIVGEPDASIERREKISCFGVDCCKIGPDDLCTIGGRPTTIFYTLAQDRFPSHCWEEVIKTTNLCRARDLWQCRLSFRVVGEILFLCPKIGKRLFVWRYIMEYLVWEHNCYVFFQ